MDNNLKIIIVNFGCKNISFEEVTVLHRTTAKPCCIG